MGNLAQIARELNHEVLGCDNKVYPPMSEKLESVGINFSEGYEESNFCLLYTSPSPRDA